MEKKRVSRIPNIDLKLRDRRIRKLVCGFYNALFSLTTPKNLRACRDYLRQVADGLDNVLKAHPRLRPIRANHELVAEGIEWVTSFVGTDAEKLDAMERLAKMHFSFPEYIKSISDGKEFVHPQIWDDWDQLKKHLHILQRRPPGRHKDNQVTERNEFIEQLRIEGHTYRGAVRIASKRGLVPSGEFERDPSLVIDRIKKSLKRNQIKVSKVPKPGATPSGHNPA